MVKKYDPIVRIAKVECTASPDLCKNIIAYPTINVYRSSKFVEELLVYDIPNVEKYADTVYAARTQTKTDTAKYVLDKYLEDNAKKSSEWNKDGQIVHLTQDDFKDQTKDKAWMLMFHAPVQLRLTKVVLTLSTNGPVIRASGGNVEG